MKRREFLRVGLSGVAASFVLPPRSPRKPVPRVNGGINVAPLRRLEPNQGLTPPLIVPELIDLQMKLVYELGFEQMRIMISFERFGPNFLAAIPYVRAARALGIDVVGIVGQFAGADLVRAISDPATRDEVLETYARIFGAPVLAASTEIDEPGRFAAQIMNEPTHFHGISPDAYVRSFLRPSYLHLKEDDPSIQIISAAPVSTAEGFLRAQVMIEAGLEHVCDVIAFHVYSTQFLDGLQALTSKPLWVTESGVEGTSRHLAWLTSTFETIRQTMPAVEQIYWFDLFDMAPNRFRLFDIAADAVGTVHPVRESEAAISRLESRVQEAGGGEPRARYEELIPDILLYFPAEEDLRLIEQTSFGLPEGLPR